MENSTTKKIEIELLDFIREERKFASVKELKKQIQKDYKLVSDAIFLETN